MEGNAKQRQAQLLIDNSGQAEEEDGERRNSMWDGFSPFLYKYLQVNAYRVSATIASAVGSTAVANEFIDKTRSGGWFLHLSAVVENALGRQAGRQ